MDWLKELFPKVRTTMLAAVPKYWKGFHQLLDKRYAETLPTEIILPLAACKAVGGNPEEAVGVTAALLAIEASMRILDDVQDQDRPDQLWREIGPERAVNYAFASSSLAYRILLREDRKAIDKVSSLQSMIEESLELLHGQERDITGLTNTLEDYWTTVEKKSARPYALACRMGAQVGTPQKELIDACTRFGHHLGMCIQIFNDMESIWGDEKMTDLTKGKLTLPVIYGITIEHPDKLELMAIVRDKQIAEKAERVKEILENIDTKKFLIWSAMQERNAALKALNYCPDNEGKRALEYYINGLFGDLEELEKSSKDQTEKMMDGVK